MDGMNKVQELNRKLDEFLAGWQEPVAKFEAKGVKRFKNCPRCKAKLYPTAPMMEAPGLSERVCLSCGLYLQRERIRELEERCGDDVESGQRVRPVESASTGEPDGEVGGQDGRVSEESHRSAPGDQTAQAE